MALQRFIESYSFDSNVFQKIVSSHKITEAEIKKISSTKLSENTRKYIEDNQINLNGKTVWHVPVSRYDWKNANGRVYEKRLWKNVIENQKDSYQGSVGLADHPNDDEDGKFKEIAVVWLDMGLNEADNEDDKIVWGECVFVGPHGKLAEEIMEAGGRVGFSSSGFGELDESDKSTVRWDTYQLERPSDLVLNPSQRVYGKKENKKESTSVDSNLNEKDMNPRKEPNLKKCKVCGHDYTGSGELCPDCRDKNIKQENTRMDDNDLNNYKMSKKELREFREDITRYLNDLSSTEDLQEKLHELEEIKSYFSPSVAPDLLSEVEKQIKETREAIDAAIKEHSMISKTFGVTSAEELREGVKRLAVDTQYYERDAQDWKKIAEGLQDKIKMYQKVISSRPPVEEYKKLLIDMKDLKEKSNINTIKYARYIEELKGKIIKKDDLTAKIMKELEKSENENSKLYEYANNLKAYSAKLQEKLQEYRESQKAIHEAIETKKMEESVVKFRPSVNSSPMFKDFNESSEVQEYYEDLEKRYGNDIVPFKEKILGSKTVRDAMVTFNKVFSKLGNIEKVTEALSPEERKQIIEKTINVKFRESSKLDTRLPATWE